MSGLSSSVPTRDHVPELRNAVPSRATTAATAEPVSCEAGAITGVPVSAESEVTSFDSVPTIVPGSTISAGNSEGSSSFSMRLRHHPRFCEFTIWVVVAFVNSQTAFPVSQ